MARGGVNHTHVGRLVVLTLLLDRLLNLTHLPLDKGIVGISVGMILGESMECFVVHPFFDHVSWGLGGFDEDEKNNHGTDDLAKARDSPAP